MSIEEWIASIDAEDAAREVKRLPAKRAAIVDRREAAGIPKPFRDYEPEQAYGTHHDLREHLRHGGRREDY